MTGFTAVILAAGEGTRMKSNIPKMLHRVCGIPMLGHVINAAKKAGAGKVVAVVGKGAQEVQKAFESQEINFVMQAEQKGTGHALMQARKEAEGTGILMVLYGDMPLVTAESIAAMVKFHSERKPAATVMTARVQNPTGYGRIIREGQRVLAIREEKDASAEERAITEINSGFYCFDASLVFEALSKVKNDNRQGEFYLTDVVEIFNGDGRDVLAFEIADPLELSGINDRCQLAFAQSVMQKRIIGRWMNEGVTFINPDSCVVDVNVTIGKDTIIYPGVLLEGETHIGEGCLIVGPSRIKDSRIGNNAEIIMSQILESTVEDKVKIGPFSNLRPGCRIGQEVKIGDFVEMKNASVGPGSKVPHLSYVGDAVIGKKVNIGAGTIFVNYDGYKKHQTVVEDGAFIGCNSNLIAPVAVKSGSYVAAGSTITREVPENSLAVARARQENKIGWAEKRRKKIEGGNNNNG
ncbi:MAG: bifunctional UDP-N-acetylglucosamine diphosphorylase/glucosamine-1-phosphate N-acetyltransferase GlmU [Tepidanaerobacteraceae bacterium]|jgi:bifunctional UDP-N-acetylglucosamine pyrophosphorylase/glucosamine-1-phosphate N-acetyltransferase|nr:bifunctional UDP-N-acetylglucosamine diphosphorylase/glucosamine-1-phosphate N-acetyltransferase GlmU [Tepidanaerobacteraceae bacterium]